MGFVAIKARIADYDAWRKVYDGMTSVRKEWGCKGERAFRNSSNPAEVLVLLEWDDMRKCQEYTMSTEARDAMSRAGVQGPPEVTFLNEV